MQLPVDLSRPGRELELDEEELLDELLEESSLSGTPPLVNMMTALKYPRYPGSENCIMPILPSP